MKYEIFGETMPIVTFTLDKGERIKSSAGAMKWMDDTVDMEASMDGGVGGFLKRKLMQESGMLNTYTARRDDSRVAFGHSYPGHIIPVNVADSNLICQKRAYLCSTMDVELEIAFQQKLGSGFFGGEGFIMQKLLGTGQAFVEIDGEVVEMELEPGQTIKVETGSVGMYEESVNMDIRRVEGVKNMVFGGEGLFLTVLTGPGKIWLQTMPIQNMSGEIRPYLNIKNN